MEKHGVDLIADFALSKAVTKRAGRKKDAQGAGSGGAQPQVRKAVFETTKKKEVGVSDLTLISKISNEAINDNLKKRFENGEIYVCRQASHEGGPGKMLTWTADLYRPCLGLRQPF